jgi:hypothetical protein
MTDRDDDQIMPIGGLVDVPTSPVRQLPPSALGSFRINRGATCSNAQRFFDTRFSSKEARNDLFGAPRTGKPRFVGTVVAFTLATPATPLAAGNS